MCKETFKFIEGFEDYLIGDLGSVISLKNPNKPYKMHLFKNHDGYLTVQLRMHGKGKNFLVHDLVARAFIPCDDESLEVNHKDEVKSNNVVSNLEWCTHRYNMSNKNLMKRIMKTKFEKGSLVNNLGNGHQCICEETGEIFESYRKAGLKYGTTSARIKRLCRNNKALLGLYHFKDFSRSL